MKKSYDTPAAEKIEFDYRSQVVAKSQPGCWATVEYRVEVLGGSCISEEKDKIYNWHDNQSW